MSTLQEKIDVMTAASNGAEVEWSDRDSDNWRLIPNPVWDWSCGEYRIAKPALKKVVFFAYRSDAGELCWFASGCLRPGKWKRVPAEDKEVEVQE